MAITTVTASLQLPLTIWPQTKAYFTRFDVQCHQCFDYNCCYWSRRCCCYYCYWDINQNTYYKIFAISCNHSCQTTHIFKYEHTFIHLHACALEFTCVCVCECNCIWYLLAGPQEQKALRLLWAFRPHFTNYTAHNSCCN